MTPFWHTPQHQPHEGREVRFQLRPLDKRGRYTLPTSFNENGLPSADAAHETALASVCGWDGIGTADDPKPFSRQALRQAIEGEATPDDVDWMMWVAEIAGALFSRSMLRPDEKKG
jgi:hypothetical protein